MANCFHLCLMTAEETMLDEAAEYCRIPTADGSVGILADHANSVTILTDRAEERQSR